LHAPDLQLSPGSPCECPDREADECPDVAADECSDGVADEAESRDLPACE
jgi:hypothetical protein